MRWLLLPVLASGLSGCYLGHVGWGQIQLLAARQPVAEVLADPDTPAALADQLRLALRARDYAVQQLGLPDNGSYRCYADIERPYVVWNLFAAAEFSVKPKTWCYPLVGCLAYRGYHDPERAARAAEDLRGHGYDVSIGPVAAYSTLGWFDDPLLNTMLGWSEERLVGLLFHELAHQVVFVDGDTGFNESYASFVEQQGLRQWLADQPERLAALDESRRLQREFVGLVSEAREELDQLYALPIADAEKRRRKQQVFDALRARYATRRDKQWNGDRRYDGWFERELGNADLVPVGLYNRWVPAFEAVFRAQQGDWPAFHAAVEALAAREPEERRSRLEALDAAS